LDEEDNGSGMLRENIFSNNKCTYFCYIQLCSYNGKRHLPLPTGKYSVGACDLMTNETFMRLYYPHSDNPQSTFENSSLWLKWFPSLEYADGYLRFKFSRSIPLAARVLSWITGDPYCPIAKVHS